MEGLTSGIEPTVAFWNEAMPVDEKMREEFNSWLAQEGLPATAIPLGGVVWFYTDKVTYEAYRLCCGMPLRYKSDGRFVIVERVAKNPPPLDCLILSDAVFDSLLED